MAIVITRAKADADLLRNSVWLARKKTIEFATRWLASIQTSISSLASNPDRYPEADEAQDLGMNLRFKMHGRRPHIYRILFIHDDTTVNVIRVLHAAQDRLTADDL